MALSTKQDPPDEPRVAEVQDVRQVPKIDCSSQTDPVSDAIHTGDSSNVTHTGSGTDIQTSNAECQTDEELQKPKPTPQPQADPDAMKEAKSQLQLLAAELDEARRQLTDTAMLKLEMEDT